MKKLMDETFHWWLPFTQMSTFFKRMPVIIEKAEGVYLIDSSGRKFLDLNSSMWNVCLGHNRPEIINAICEQYKILDFTSPFRASNNRAVELAKKITDLCHPHFQKVFFTCNGSDSVEAGIKLARQYYRIQGKKKYKIISLKNSYHGVSYGAMAASGFDEDKEDYMPIPEGFIQIPQPYCYRCPYQQTYPGCGIECALFLEKVIQDEGQDSVAMFLIEPVQGMGGVIIPPLEYFVTIQKICRQYDILLMLDEVTTGFARTGRMFAYQHWDLTPDLMALGKAMSNGSFPIGATMIKQGIWDTFMSDESVRFNHGSTYFGHPVGSAAAIACIDILQKEDWITRVNILGEFFSQLLRNLLELPVVGDIRGIGLIYAIELVQDKASKKPIDDTVMMRFIRVCHMLGLWAHFVGNNMLIFPPYSCQNDQLEQAVVIIKRAITSVNKR